MIIKGTHTLDSPIGPLWTLLQDPAVLARISPGVSSLEAIGEDRYKAVSEISVGPVRGSFEGEIAIIDKVNGEQMTLQLNQNSKIGNAEATIKMHLSPAEEGARTLITYDGKAKVSGRLASMGQRILGGAVKTLSRQVFAELDKIINEKESPSEPMAQTASEKETPGIFTLLFKKLSELWKSLFK